jgi:hypothetical protein
MEQTGRSVRTACGAAVASAFAKPAGALNRIGADAANVRAFGRHRWRRLGF